MPGGVAAVRFLGKVIVSAGILGCLVGLIHFHITTITTYAYLTWALAGSLVIYLWSRPSVRSLTGTLLLGAAFSVVYGIVEGGPLLEACLAFLGLGSLSLAELWSGPNRRHSSLDTCLTASMFPLFLIVAGFSFGCDKCCASEDLRLVFICI